MPLNVLAIGASRNIGYHSAIRFLDSGATVTFLLRSPTVFDSDVVIQKYMQSGKARLVKGDALVEDDVQLSWREAGKDGPIDLLLCTVGGTPQFSLTKGFVIKPANLVTQALTNALITMPRTQPQPRIITISSVGLSKSSHDELPVLMKPLYGHFLKAPHKDKIGAERVMFHCAGWEWNTKDDGEPDNDIMGENWRQREGLPTPGSLKSVLIIRPVLLTDGECRADDPKKKGYRVSEGELGSYVVSRKDVAHFVADAVINKWSQYENKVVNIGY